MNEARRMLLSEVKSIVVSALSLDVAPERIGDDDPLFDPSQGIDSVLAIEILLTMEDVFGLTFADEDLGESVFASVQTLAGLVERARARGPHEVP